MICDILSIKRKGQFSKMTTANGFYGVIKTLKDWFVMTSVAALTIGVFREKDDLAALVGITAFISALALGWYLERRKK